MTDLDTIARRHAEVVRNVAASESIPDLALSKAQPSTQRRRLVSVLVAAALVVAFIVPISWLSPDVADQVVGNGYIVTVSGNPVQKPYVLTPLGAEGARPVLPDGVGLGMYPSLSWAPDGRRLAMIGVAGVLYIVDTHTSEVESSFELQESCQFACAIDWSPDGTEIALIDSNRTLLVVDPITGEKEILLDSTQGDAPSWSPDGEWIAFIAFDGVSEPNLYKVHRDTAEVRLLAEGIFGPMEWSPTSDTIAVLRYEPMILRNPPDPGDLELIMVSGDGNSVELVGSLGTCWCFNNIPSLAWSPDGSKLMIRAPNIETNAEADILVESGKSYLMKPDGTDLQPLVSSGFDVGKPAWQPVLG